MNTKTLLITIHFSLIFGNLVFANPRIKNTKSFDTLKTSIDKKGLDLEFVLEKGNHHNHPTFAIWLEDLEGNYIQPLLVTKFIATGIYARGPLSDTTWGTEPGEAYRPAALPYWNHKRREQPQIEKIMPGKNDPIPDGYTAATPKASFVLKASTDKPIPNSFRLLMEINQTWDWNEYWTNNKFPENKAYKSSSQPSVVYAVTVHTGSGIKEYWLNPVGHGHYAGSNGDLYTNLTTITTALDIYKTIKVTLKK